MESVFEFLYTKTYSLLKYIILSEAYAQLSYVRALNNTQTAKPAARACKFFTACLSPEGTNTLLPTWEEQWIN